MSGQTGVEMEALTAVSVACLTIYDMLKAADKAMTIGEIRLLEKTGGRSGTYRAAGGAQGLRRYSVSRASDQFSGMTAARAAGVSRRAEARITALISPDSAALSMNTHTSRPCGLEPGRDAAGHRIVGRLAGDVDGDPPAVAQGAPHAGDRGGIEHCLVGEVGPADVDADGVEAAALLAHEGAHVADDAFDAVGHPEERPRQLEADGVHIEDRDGAAAPVQHGRQRSAAAAEQQDAVAAGEKGGHQANVLDAGFPARQHAALADAALAVVPRAGGAVLDDGDLAVGTGEARKKLHAISLGGAGRNSYSTRLGLS